MNKRIASRFLGLLGAALLAGCVSLQDAPLASSDADVLRGREVALTSRPLPDFYAGNTAQHLLIGGLVGGVIAGERGNRLVAEHNIPDPAVAIGEAIVAELQDAHKLRLAQGTIPVTAEGPADLARQAPGGDLVLDVQTVNWGYFYFPLNWNRYWVQYAARLRLIDIRRAQVIAEGGCEVKPADIHDSSNAPTGDELVANGAERLKRELQAATRSCLERFRTTTFAFAARAPALEVAAAPAAPIARTGTAVPQAGDTWTYRLTEPKRADGPAKRNYTVKISAASYASIVEQYAIDDGPSGEWTHTGERQVVGLGKSVFAPYLLAFGHPAAGSLGKLQVLDCGSAYVCQASGRVVSRERIRVPAGVFDAVKVEVQQDWRAATISGYHGAQMHGGRVLTVWYAPEAKRAVKFASRTTVDGIAPIDTEFDLELMSFQLK